MGHSASKEAVDSTAKAATTTPDQSKDPVVESQYDTNTLPAYNVESSSDAEEPVEPTKPPDKVQSTSPAKLGHNKFNGFPAALQAGEAMANKLNSRVQAPAPPQTRDDVAPANFITDDQVQVNLAMADLMAYLQVVANNSNNLPVTRRDDPDIGRTVSSLTSDEYARKSAAFIPADVRIICGSFTKYGRVWDLPTSEEYTACDGAQEPGRSYGGACCNAMLKVLYDAANDAGDKGHAMADSLFDDDDEESMMMVMSKPHELERERTYASLVVGDYASMPRITWADLLRKMKAEIRDIEYAQTPVVTSSQKFDLNKPFSLIPSDFDPKRGKKRSLLIGCNYTDDSGAELKASHDDIRSMKDYIVNVHGFPETKGLMTVLLDDGVHTKPTHHNITEAFKALSEQSQPGDAVFVQFSGHGGRVLSTPGQSETETYDEVIVPTDYLSSGLVRDTLFFKTLLAPMRYGVSVTVLIDCCDTGAVIDLPYVWQPKSDRPHLAKLSTNDDFSFVRFLKVVKTLYESSTFTQLGMTVGTALNKPAPRDNGRDTEDDETLAVTSNETHDEETISKKSGKGSGSLLSVLASCTSPTGTQVKVSKKKLDDKGTVATRETRGSPQSLLEQVMNCTLAHDDEESDVDDDFTYNTRTIDGDDHSYGDGTIDTSTFDSLNDDSYAERPRGRSKRR